jgi:hypothetical protein
VFSSINQFLNIFFTLYWWIFFTPYIEINSGIIACGANSFLVQYRELPSNCGKPLWQPVLGYIGVSLSITTGIIVIIFFRNYEFNESNALKRKYNFIQIPILLLRFLTTYLYY